MSVTRIDLDSDLRLELLTPFDAQEVFDLVETNRDHLRPFLPWVDGSRELADTAAFIRGACEDLADLKQIQYTILHEGRLVGLIGAMRRYTGTGVYHLGYWIDREAAGQGIITRCAEVLTRFCFTTLKAPKVEILCATENHPSNRVAQKLGFELEGTLRCAEKLPSGLADLNVYGKLAPTESLEGRSAGLQ